jgi:hypothetical protein
MINIHRQSVNVSRKELLAKLKENLAVHQKDYEEACVGYKTLLERSLVEFLTKCKSLNEDGVLKLQIPNPSKPVSHEKEYREIIDMMEVSVDDVINLDSESFKAYFKNEWAWSGSFNATATMYKSALGGTVN